MRGTKALPKAVDFSTSWTPVIVAISCIALIAFTIAILSFVSIIDPVVGPEASRARFGVYPTVKAASVDSTLLRYSNRELDGIVIHPGDRVLFKDAEDSRDNGIYMLTESGVYRRSPEMSHASQIVPGNSIYVSQGDIHGRASFLLIVNDMTSSELDEFDAVTGAGIRFENANRVKFSVERQAPQPGYLATFDPDDPNLIAWAPPSIGIPPITAQSILVNNSDVTQTPQDVVKLDMGGLLTRSEHGLISLPRGQSDQVLRVHSNGNLGWSELSELGVTSLEGTANQIVVSATRGHVQLSLPQPLATGSSPVFSDITVEQIFTDKLNDIIVSNRGLANLDSWQLATGAASGYVLRSDNDGFGNWQNMDTLCVTTLSGTPNQVTVSASMGHVTLSLPQAIGVSDSPTFDSIHTTVLTASQPFLTTLDNVTTLNGIVVGASSLSALQSLTTAHFRLTTSPTAGYMLVTDAQGNGSWTNPQTLMVTSIQGTSDQITVSSTQGAVTLSLPQAIATTSSPTFVSLSATLLTAHQPNITDLDSVTLLNGITVGYRTLSNLETLSTAAFQLTTNASSGFVLASDSEGRGSWVDPATLGVTFLNGTAQQINVSSNQGLVTMSLSNTLKAPGSFTATTSVTSPVLLLNGSDSGTISIQPQSHAGTYHFNLPTTAGASGELLTSGGGVDSAMTWTSIDAIAVSSLSGTTNQINVSNNIGTVNLSLPLNMVAPGSLTLSSFLNAPYVQIKGASSGLISIVPQASSGTYSFNLPISAGGMGQLLTSGGGSSAPMSWSTIENIAVSSLTGTTNQLTVSANVGAITLSLPNTLIAPGTLSAVTSLAAPQLLLSGSVAVLPASVTDSYHFNLPASSGTTGQLLTSGGGANNPMTWSTISNIAVSNVSGTANQISVSANTGAVTLSLPNSLIVPGSLAATNYLSAPQLVLTGSSSGVVTLVPQAMAGTYTFNLPTSAGTAGQLLTSGGGGTGTPMTWSSVSTIAVSALSGTSNQINVSSSTGSVTLSLPLNMTVPGSLAAPSFSTASFRLTQSPSAGYVLRSDATGVAAWTNPNTFSVTSLSGTPQQINVSAAQGDITLSLPQAIDSLADVLFHSMLVDNGTSTAPGVAFKNSTSSGMYLSAPHQVSVAANGIEAFRVDSSGNITIPQNLIVNGTTFVVDSQTFSVADNIAVLATSNPADSLDIGLGFQYVSGSVTNYGVLYRASGTNDWLIKDGVTTSPGSNVVGGFLANLVVANLTGTLLTATQPNVTTLESVTNLNNITVGSRTLSNLLSMTTAGFKFTTGAGAGLMLQSDSLGNASWVALSTLAVTTISGTTNQISTSSSQGVVTLSLPSTLIAPGSLVATTSASAPRYLLNGTSSGTITIIPQAVAGTYNFNLPTTAGATGQLLTSGGGASGAMTWSSISAIAVSSLSGTNNQIVVSNNTGAVTLSLPSTLIAPGTVSTTQLLLTGSSSGTVTIVPQSAAGTYNFNLPITAGTSGQLLTSGGGVSAPMSWSTISSIAVSSLSGTSNQIVASGSTGSVTLSLSSTLVAPGTLAAITSVSAPQILLTGATSGTISILPQAVAGTYNFNMPTTAGTSGQLLTSGGGASAPMTWSSISTIAVSSLTGTTNQISVSSSTGAVTLSLSNTLLAPGTITAVTSISAPQWLVTGSASGTISILPQAVAGTYNFNLPASAGNAGQFLTSGGGAGTPMSWSSISSVAVSSLSGTSNQITASGSTGAVTLSLSSTLIAPGSITATTSMSTPQMLLSGGTSGTISILPQTNAGTYNFNLPTTAGTSGYVLTSGGGGSTPMTWTNIAAFGVSIVNGTPNQISASTLSGVATLSLPTSVIFPGDFTVPSTAKIGNTRYNTESIELNTDGTGNRYSYIDFHCDDTYTDFGLRLVRGNSGPDTNSALIHRGVGQLEITTLDAADIVFKASNYDRLRISSGTSGLFFYDTTGTERFRVQPLTSGVNLLGQTAGLSLNNTGAYDMTFLTTNIERMRILSSGEVGIGTAPLTRSYGASGSHNLSIASTTGNRCTQVLDSTDQRLTLAAYWEAGVAQYSYIQASNDAETGSNTLVLNPAGGNVGVGTANPAGILQTSIDSSSVTLGSALNLVLENRYVYAFGSGKDYGTNLVFQYRSVGDGLGNPMPMSSIESRKAENNNTRRSYMAFMNRSGSSVGSDDGLLEGMRLSWDRLLHVGEYSNATPANTRLAAMGSYASQSTSQNKLLTLYNAQSGSCWPQVVDFTVGRYSSEVSTVPYTRMDINLKSDANATVAGNVTVMTMRSDGNVGIGVTSPNARLHVENSVVSGAGLNFLTIKNAGGGWSTAGDYSDTRLITTIPGGNPAKLSRVFNVGIGGVGIGFAPPTYTSSETDALYVSGNVGFGTNTPGKPLSLVGDTPLRLSADALESFYYDMGRAASTGGFVINGSQTGSVSYEWQKSGSALMNLSNVGNLTLAGTVERSFDRYSNRLFGTYGSAIWVLVGTWNSSSVQGSRLDIRVHGAGGYGSLDSFSMGVSHIHLSTGNQTGGPNIVGHFYSTGGTPAILGVKAKANTGNGTTTQIWDVYMYVNSYVGPGSFLEVQCSNNNTWTLVNTSTTDPGSASATIFVATNAFLTQGNVGIGTVSPVTKLTVVGSGAVTPSLSADTGTFTINNGNDLTLQFGQVNSPGSAGLFMQGKRANNDGTPWSLYLNPLGGSVGVGNSAPDTRLHVTGTSISSMTTTTVQEIFKLSQPNTGNGGSSKGSHFSIGLSFFENPVLNYPRTRVDFKTTGRTTDDTSTPMTVMSLVDTGYVGIGTVSPAQLLDIRASTTSSMAAIQIKNTGQWGAANLILDQNHDGAGDLSTNMLAFYRGGTFKAAIGVSSATTGGVADSLLINMGGTNISNAKVVINPTGNVGVGLVDPNYNLEISGPMNIRTNQTLKMGTVDTIARSSVSGAVTIATNVGDIISSPGGVERMRVTSSGCVGIGTSSPATLYTKLDVNGTIASEVQLGFAWLGDVATARWFSSLGSYNLSFFSDTAGGISLENQTQFAANWKCKVRFEPTGMRVAGDILQSWPSGTSLYRNQLYFDATYNMGNVYDPANRIFCIDNQDSDSGVSTRASIQFRTGSGPSTRMTITNGGSVAIGTTSPSALFDVKPANGTVDGITFGNSSSGATASRYIGIIGGSSTNIGVNSGFSGMEFGPPNTTNDGYLAFHTHQYGAQSGERIRIDKVGNVGIRTTTPYQGLEIGSNLGLGFSGSSLNSLDKKLYSPLDGELQWFTHDGATAHAFSISHQGTRRVYLNTGGVSYFTGGDVTINTTTNAAKLTVYGTTNIARFGDDLGGDTSNSAVSIYGNSFTPFLKLIKSGVGSGYMSMSSSGLVFNTDNANTITFRVGAPGSATAPQTQGTQVMTMNSSNVATSVTCNVGGNLSYTGFLYRNNIVQDYTISQGTGTLNTYHPNSPWGGGHYGWYDNTFNSNPIVVSTGATIEVTIWGTQPVSPNAATGVSIDFYINELGAFGTTTSNCTGYNSTMGITNGINQRTYDTYDRYAPLLNYQFPQNGPAGTWSATLRWQNLVAGATNIYVPVAVDCVSSGVVNYQAPDRQTGVVGIRSKVSTATITGFRVLQITFGNATAPSTHMTYGYRVRVLL